MLDVHAPHQTVHTWKDFLVHIAAISTLGPDDRLIFVRKFSPLGSTAWRVVHESGAAAYIPYEQMAKYGEIYRRLHRNYVNLLALYAALAK